MDKSSSLQAASLRLDDTHVRDMPKFVGQSLTFGQVDDVLLACHEHHPLRDDEWQAFLARLGKPGYRVILISTLGAEPDARQRHQFHACFAASSRQVPLIAVLTASPTMRWANLARRFSLHLDAKTLAFHELEHAARFLGCRASVERLRVARSRAHYLLEKRAAREALSVG